MIVYSKILKYYTFTNNKIIATNLNLFKQRMCIINGNCLKLIFRKKKLRKVKKSNPLVFQNLVEKMDDLKKADEIPI